MRYKVLEAAVASVLEAGGDLGAFRARMRHFRNLGLPRTDRPGKGGVIEYGRKDAFEVLVAMQLNVMGVNPKSAAGAAWIIADHDRPGLTGESEQFYDVLYPPPLASVPFRRNGHSELAEELSRPFTGMIVLNTTELANKLATKLDELERGEGDGGEGE